MEAIQSNGARPGLKAMHERVVKQNAEACFAFASEFAIPRTSKDVVGIQGRDAQTEMQAYALQAQELGNLIEKASQGVRPRGEATLTPKCIDPFFGQCPNE